MSNLKCVGASTLVSTLTVLQIQVTIWDKHDRYKLIFQMPKTDAKKYYLYIFGSVLKSMLSAKSYRS